MKMYRHAINLVHPSPKDTKSFKSLTYIGLPSLSISSFFKNLDFNIAFKTTNTLVKTRQVYLVGHVQKGI